MAFQPSMFVHNSRSTEMHWSAGCSRALLAGNQRVAQAGAQSQQLANAMLLHHQQQQQQAFQQHQNKQQHQQQSLNDEDTSGSDELEEDDDDLEQEIRIMSNQSDQMDDRMDERELDDNDELDFDEKVDLLDSGAEQECALNLSFKNNSNSGNDNNNNITKLDKQQQQNQLMLMQQITAADRANSFINGILMNEKSSSFSAAAAAATARDLIYKQNLQALAAVAAASAANQGNCTDETTTHKAQSLAINKHLATMNNNNAQQQHSRQSITSTSQRQYDSSTSSLSSSSSSTSSSSSSSGWSSAAESLTSCSPQQQLHHHLNNTNNQQATSISPYSNISASLLQDVSRKQSNTNNHQSQQQQLNLHHNHQGQQQQQQQRPLFLHHHHHHHHHHEGLGPIHKADSDDLDRIRNFIEQFKSRRGALGLTQKQAAQCFRAYTNDRYAFSDNFVGHFEGFQFRPQTAMTIADSLAEWLEFAENETRQGRQLSFMPGKVKETRKRKYEVIRIRDSAKRVLVEAFEKNKSPSTSELELLSRKTNIPSRNIEIFFKNRRTSRQYHQ